jgi:hypothetical protein
VPGWAFQLLNLVFIAPFQNLLLMAFVTPVYVCARLSTSAATVLTVSIANPSAVAALWNDFSASLSSLSAGAFSSAGSAGVAALSSTLGSLRVQSVPAGWSTLTISELALVGAFALLLLLETIADQQQWNFQTRKYAIDKKQWAKHADPQIRDGFLHSGLFRFSRHPNFLCEMSIWWVVYAFSASMTAWQLPLNWSIIGTASLTLLFQGLVNINLILRLQFDSFHFCLVLTAFG